MSVWQYSILIVAAFGFGLMALAAFRATDWWSFALAAVFSIFFSVTVFVGVGDPVGGLLL